MPAKSYFLVPIIAQKQHTPRILRDNRQMVISNLAEAVYEVPLSARCVSSNLGLFIDRGKRGSKSLGKPLSRDLLN